MGELLMAGPAWKLVSKQKIMPSDVIMLRQEVFAGGIQSRQDIATLLALETACDNKCPQWDELFIKSIADYMVFKEGVSGTIDEKQAVWIRQSLTRDGLTQCKNEFDALLQILLQAKAAPSSLCALVLDQICHRIYASGANRRKATEISDNDRAIIIDLNKIIDVAKRFSIHEHLRAIGLSQLIDHQDVVDGQQEQEVMMLYNG